MNQIKKQYEERLKEIERQNKVEDEIHKAKLEEQRKIFNEKMNKLDELRKINKEQNILLINQINSQFESKKKEKKKKIEKARKNNAQN